MLKTNKQKNRQIIVLNSALYGQPKKIDTNTLEPPSSTFNL